MRASGLLLVAASLCACAAGDEPSEDAASQSAGAGGAGGAPLDVPGGDGAVCNRWQHEPYGPGADGRLGSSDDVLLGTRVTYDVDEANVIVRSTHFAGAGPDGAWDTPDDVVASEMRLVSSGGPQAYFVSYDGPGADGTWGTADDSITAAAWAELDGTGRPVDQRTLSGPGDDGQWLTSDDWVDRRHAYSYGDGQQTPKLLDFEFVSFGDDGVWGTSDDPVAVATRRFDDWGTFSSAPGSDGAWGTEDDVLDARYEDKHDWKGYVQYHTLFLPGPDMVVFSPDDEVTSVATSKCEDDALDARLVATAGMDGEWGTPDDDLTARLRITGCGDPCGSAMPTSPVEPPK